jgi:hypothetical protein
MSLSQAESWARRAKRDAGSDMEDAVETLAKAVLELIKEVKRLQR